jgi:hypothetical protein
MARRPAGTRLAVPHEFEQFLSGYAGRSDEPLSRERMSGETSFSARRKGRLTSMARNLRPLLLAAGPTRDYLTPSGAYYVPFGWPSRFGVHKVALHVADGSGIFAQRTRGPTTRCLPHRGSRRVRPRGRRPRRLRREGQASTIGWSRSEWRCEDRGRLRGGKACFSRAPLPSSPSRRPFPRVHRRATE